MTAILSRLIEDHLDSELMPGAFDALRDDRRGNEENGRKFAHLQLESPSTVALARGALITRVPSHVVGVAVKMPWGRSRTYARSSRSVSAPTIPSTAMLSPLRISRGMAAKVDAQIRQPESIAYDEEQRIVMP
jgi:hypothetical protein